MVGWGGDKWWGGVRWDKWWGGVGISGGVG